MNRKSSQNIYFNGTYQQKRLPYHPIRADDLQKEVMASATPPPPSTDQWNAKAGDFSMAPPREQSSLFGSSVLNSEMTHPMFH
jgi:hypothetical protein